MAKPPLPYNAMTIAVDDADNLSYGGMTNTRDTEMRNHSELIFFVIASIIGTAIIFLAFA